MGSLHSNLVLSLNISRLHHFRGQVSLRLRNDYRNFVLMMCHYQVLSGASDWSCHVGNFLQPIRSTTQILVVMRHQYGISAFVPQPSFHGETSGSVAKGRLFA